MKNFLNFFSASSPSSIRKRPSGEFEQAKLSLFSAAIPDSAKATDVKTPKKMLFPVIIVPFSPLAQRKRMHPLGFFHKTRT